MYDVEVLGAGPSGSYVANALARRGFSVRPVDRVAFPRDQLCDGGLTRKALDVIRRPEPSLDRAGPAESVREFVLPDALTASKFGRAIEREWAWDPGRGPIVSDPFGPDTSIEPLSVYGRLDRPKQLDRDQLADHPPAPPQPRRPGTNRRVPSTDLRLP